MREERAQTLAALLEFLSGERLTVVVRGHPLPLGTHELAGMVGKRAAFSPRPVFGSTPRWARLISPGRGRRPPLAKHPRPFTLFRDASRAKAKKHA